MISPVRTCEKDSVGAYGTRTVKPAREPLPSLGQGKVFWGGDARDRTCGIEVLAAMKIGAARQAHPPKQTTQFLSRLFQTTALREQGTEGIAIPFAVKHYS